MMKSRTILTAVIGVLLAASLSCNRNKAPVAEGSLESGAAGIRLVATYDARFDRIVPGYRILSITFVNQSPKLIELDGKKDRWTLTTATGGTAQAVASLRQTDPKTWNALSSKAQELLEYPRVILRNTTLTFDLLVPKSIDLRGFRLIEFYCAALNETFTGNALNEETAS